MKRRTLGFLFGAAVALPLVGATALYAHDRAVQQHIATRPYTTVDNTGDLALGGYDPKSRTVSVHSFCRNNSDMSKPKNDEPRIPAEEIGDCVKVFESGATGFIPKALVVPAEYAAAYRPQTIKAP